MTKEEFSTVKINDKVYRVGYDIDPPSLSLEECTIIEILPGFGFRLSGSLGQFIRSNYEAYELTKIQAVEAQRPFFKKVIDRAQRSLDLLDQLEIEIKKENK